SGLLLLGLPGPELHDDVRHCSLLRFFEGDRRRIYLRYCSSVTCSIQSTTLPWSASWMAMCVMAVVGAAPCQCFSPGGNQTTSPGRISSIGPPSCCARPTPAVTISVWPSGCVCQAVRAPGSNVTLAPATRAGAGAWNRGSMRTVPVNQSAGPLLDGCEPIRLISIFLVLRVLSCCFLTVGFVFHTDRFDRLPNASGGRNQSASSLRWPSIRHSSSCFRNRARC